MKPEEVKKLGDVFLFLNDQQKKLEKLIESKEEVCELCGQISEKCDCEEAFI